MLLPITSKHLLYQRSEWSYVTKASNIPSYFRNSFYLTKTPGVGELFTSKYTLITSFFVFVLKITKVNSMKQNISYDPLYKIRTNIDVIKKTLICMYLRTWSVFACYETMVKFKGRISFKQYLSSKLSTKWGIKIWSLSDSDTASFCNFNI